MEQSSADHSAAPVLMVLGTASSVGKSVLVTALCRIFRQDGMRVAPFKAQNMSNNAAVTLAGLEIGRAQAEQAAAAGIEPTVEMNPVLLKPQGDRTSQVVLLGRPAGVLHSGEFGERTRDLWPSVARSLARLRASYEVIVAEGAGAAVEPNLREGDIVNMRVAREAAAETLLVADIERGGAFGHLVGTLALMSDEERALVKGLVLNRFRGDASLLEPALVEVEERTGIPVLGVIPWIDNVQIADEDAVALERGEAREAVAGSIDIAVVQVPHIANFDDFDALRREAGVSVRFVARAEELGEPQLIVLPGTKATIADLKALRTRGLDRAIRERAAGGTPVLGICGGYQMLGRRVRDELGTEAAAGTSVEGLGLLPTETVFAATKTTRRAAGKAVAVRGIWAAAANMPVSGYEIHMGETSGSIEPLLRLEGRADGSVSADGRVAGTYLHGIFDGDAFRRAILEQLGRAGGEKSTSHWELREREFDRVAGVVREHLDMDSVRSLLGVAAQT